PTNPLLTRENFDRIKKGIPREGVEGILGPPGDYRTEPTTEGSIQVLSGCWVTVSEPLTPEMYLPDLALVWKGNQAEMWVVLRDGVVSEAFLNPTGRKPVGFFELLRWRWNRW